MGMLGERTQHRGGGESRTKQSDALATDVNAIMKRYVAHGVLPPMSGRRPRYGDFTDAGSFHEALDRVMAAQEEFAALPASVRDLCRNDMGVLVELLETEEGLEALRAAGLGKDQEREPVRGATIEEIREAFRIPAGDVSGEPSEEAKPSAGAD